MPIPNGFAPGFYNLADVMDRRIQDIDADVIRDAIQVSNEVHTRILNEMFMWSVEPVTWAKRRVRVSGNRLPQIITENQAPKPQRSGLSFDAGLPLQIAADSMGDNIWSRSKTTVQDVNDEMMQILDGFTDWHFYQFMVAVLNNTSWDYDDDSDDIGQLTVLPLANNDGFQYPTRSGDSEASNHYLFQNATISTANDPYKTLHNTLKVHPTNRGPYVAWVASNLVTSTESIAAYEDVDQDFIIYGNDETRVAPAVESYIGWGDEVFGVHSTTGMILVESDRLPNDYIVAQALGTGTKPVAMREQPEADARGIIDKVHMVNSNLAQTDFYRRAGMGVQNRVGAAVMQVDNASYEVPTGYGNPAD